MPFDQSQIGSVSVGHRFGDLIVSWTSGAKPGTTYQLYANQQLLWSGTRLQASIPIPADLTRIDIGTVGAGEAQANFSASLPSAPQRRVTLAWQGGNYLDPHQTRNVVGYRVFASATPAGYGSGGYGQGGYGTGYPTIPTTPTDVIPAYGGGIITDGYGMGGYGQGGYGSASASYTWTSDTLSAGLWGFSVAAYDGAGNTGSLSTLYQAVSAPPGPPAASQGGSRLSYSLVGYGQSGYGGEGYGSPGYGQGPYGGGIGYGQSEAILTWEASS